LEIQIDKHTIEKAKERGADINEINDVIENGSAISAKYKRQGKA